MAEAPDPQIGPSDAAGERQRLFEVALRVIDAQRPQLGDADVHQRRRPMVIGTPPAHGGRLGLQ